MLQPAIKIDLAHGTEREHETKALLEQLLGSYDHDLRKYTFTRHVVIEERAVNHAFPVLTLNVRFAQSADELLSSYVHEQLHWHLKARGTDQQEAIAPEHNMCRLKAYETDIDQAFGPYKEHSVVRLARQLRARHDIGFDAVTSFAVSVTDPQALSERVPFDRDGVALAFPLARATCVRVSASAQTILA